MYYTTITELPPTDIALNRDTAGEATSVVTALPVVIAGGISVAVVDTGGLEGGGLVGLRASSWRDHLNVLQEAT